MILLCGLTANIGRLSSAQQLTSSKISVGEQEEEGGGGGRAKTTPELSLDLVAPSEAFAKSTVLIEPDVLILYWSTNQTHVRFEVHAKTYGWFSLGAQVKSFVDYVVGYVNDDGSAHFSDRHRWSSTPMNATQIDARQDTTPLYTAKTNGFTVVKFARPIRACANELSGSIEDVDLLSLLSSNGLVTLVYSMGELFNGEMVYYEIRKGQRDVQLFDAANPPDEVLSKVR